MGVACLLLCSCASAPTSSEIASYDYGTTPTNYQDQIKSYFHDTLKDPYTAQYEFHQPVKYVYRESPVMGGGTYPGYAIRVSVNAKNSFGGYSGRQDYVFIFNHDQMTKVLLPEEVARMKGQLP